MKRMCDALKRTKHTDTHTHKKTHPKNVFTQFQKHCVILGPDRQCARQTLPVYVHKYTESLTPNFLRNQSKTVVIGENDNGNY